MAVTTPACVDDSGDDRWVTTENTTVDIDWDAVGKAYREAEGPEDFERRVNEIYAGDEVLSVSVKDADAQTQLVTGFFDADGNGKVADAEKVFSIQRELKTDSEAQYQIHGYGAYAGYHSPMWNIASGMFMGAMMARMFSPGYAPMYTRPYVTSPARQGQLVAQRNAYRKANPSKFRTGQASKSGRQYGRKGGQFGGGKTQPRRTPTRTRMPRGGGRFGSTRPAGRKVVRLS